MNEYTSPAALSRHDSGNRRSTVLPAMLVSIVAVGIGIAACALIVSSPGSGPSSTPGAPAEALSGIAEPSAFPEGSGELPDGTTVFDEQHAGISGLDPALLEALQEAASAAAEEDIEFQVNSGWRSTDYQTRLWEDALVEYGSTEEAAKWVAPPETSAHVSGDAVDLGPFDATYWLSNNGSDYGLCQTYANENWHFELRPEAAVDGCPAMYADPTEQEVLG